MADPIARVALVGYGPALVKAIEVLRALPTVALTVVADANSQSEGARLARSLKIPFVANPIEVLRTEADLILEVSGDQRQYERLLSVKPARVEVMSKRGTQLFLDLLERRAAPDTGCALGVVASDRQQLYDHLRGGLAGIPGVEVIADRRHASPPPSRLTGPRRVGERRRQPDADEALRARGFVITRAATKDRPA